MEFNATKLLRMAEVTSNDAAIDVMLGAHQRMGLKVIFVFFALLMLEVHGHCLASITLFATYKLSLIDYRLFYYS